MQDVSHVHNVLQHDSVGDQVLVLDALLLLDKGLMALDEALGFVEKHEERWWEAELYRLRGELLLLQGVADNVIENDFRRAINIARKQKAKSLELRATMSLSQLWYSRGKQLEARQLLPEIYDWFTEGFDSVDLKKAAKLLRKLS